MVPLVVVLVVVLFAISSIVATIAAVVIMVVCLAGLAAMRMQYLKNRPPDTELVQKPFWKF
jgi:uncharacterized membrane protein